MPSTIVALSPRTGKPLKSPRKGQKVLYGVQGARGKIKPLTTAPQEYTQADLKGFNAILKGSNGRDFVLYEQLGRANMKDASGKVIYRTSGGKPVLDSKGRKIPLKQVKITARKRPGKQRPVVFSIGRTVKKKVHDYAFRRLGKREQVDAKLAKLLPMRMAKEKPVYSEELHLTGSTIFDTVKNLRPNVDGKEMKRKGVRSLWVEGVVRVREGDGSLAAALTFSVEVKALWNFAQLIAKEIRHKLSDVGYRFTSLAELSELQSAADAAGKNVDLMRMGFLRKKVTSLTPIFPETKRGVRAKRGKPKSVSISLNITGVKGRQRTAKKKKTKRKK